MVDIRPGRVRNAPSASGYVSRATETPGNLVVVSDVSYRSSQTHIVPNSSDQCVYTDASGIMCTNHKKTDDLRCNIHMICKEEDCDMPRMLDDRGVPCEYCSDHTCFFPSCEEGKVNNAPRGYRQDLCATRKYLTVLSLRYMISC